VQSLFDVYYNLQVRVLERVALVTGPLAQSSLQLPNATAVTCIDFMRYIDNDLFQSIVVSAA